MALLSIVPRPTRDTEALDQAIDKARADLEAAKRTREEVRAVAEPLVTRRKQNHFTEGLAFVMGGGRP